MTTTTTTLRGKHLLLVEDEYYLAREMAEEFIAAGAVVVGPVSSIDRALRLIASGRPIDGAVLDINLQGEMVYPVAEVLRALGVPFVFATGYDPSYIVASYRDATICEKPVQPSVVGMALFG